MMHEIDKRDAKKKNANPRVGVFIYKRSGNQAACSSVG